MFTYLLTHGAGRAIAQAVSRWLPTAAARVRSRVWSSGICGGQSGGFPCQSSFHQLLHNHPRLSSGAGTIGQNNWCKNVVRISLKTADPDYVTFGTKIILLGIPLLVAEFRTRIKCVRPVSTKQHFIFRPLLYIPLFS
jgi:hypothetical protein